MLVINTLAPIVLIVVLGALLVRCGFLPSSFFKESNRLVYWVGIPCLLFVKTAQPALDMGAAMQVFLVLLTGTVACIIGALALGKLLGLAPISLGAFVQGAYRGNLAYVGLPVVFFALASADGRISAEVESLAVLAIAPLVPFYNIVAVIALLSGREGTEMRLRDRLRDVLAKTITNPLILACVLGLGWSQCGWRVPPVLDRSCLALGRMALPLALLGLGGTLSAADLHGRVGPGLGAAIIKLALSPLAGYAAAVWFGLAVEETRVVLLFLACPTAVVSFVMAEQLGSDAKLAAAIVLMTTILAVPALSVVLLVS